MVKKFDNTNFGMCKLRWLLSCFNKSSMSLWKIFEKELVKMNQQAYNIIRIYLAKYQKYFVTREIVAKDLWRKLERKYMIKSVENRFYLTKRLLQFQYKDFILMCKHLKSYNKIQMNFRIWMWKLQRKTRDYIYWILYRIHMIISRLLYCIKIFMLSLKMLQSFDQLQVSCDG